MEDKVAKIERVPYSGLVHNLEVSEDESYVAEGIAVHNCLCRKDGVLMKDGEFVSKLRGWMRGESRWPEMDGYAAWLGATRGTITTILAGELYEQLALPLLTWLGGKEAALEQRLESEED